MTSRSRRQARDTSTPNPCAGVLTGAGAGAAACQGATVCAATAGGPKICQVPSLYSMITSDRATTHS